MIAEQTFTGVVGGVEKLFKLGDAITEAEAIEMNLAEKSELVETELAET